MGDSPKYLWGNRMSFDFKGKFDHSIDAKNRINIPAKYRKIFTENNELDLVANWSSIEPCITVYPKFEYDELTTLYKTKLSPVSKRDRHFLRLWTMFATDCTFDNQGRITITPDLKEKAGITKDAVIIGAGDKLEIWDPNTLKQHEENAALTEEDFSLLAAELSQ